MNSSNQPPPVHFSPFEWVSIVSMSAVLVILIVAVMAVATLLSVTDFLLASPFFLLDDRRRRRSFGHPLWDSDLDFVPEPDVGEKAGAKGPGRMRSTV